MAQILAVLTSLLGWAGEPLWFKFRRPSPQALRWSLGLGLLAFIITLIWLQLKPRPRPGEMFIWLGQGRAKALGVGNKAALLDRAAQAGLPVPAGIILLDLAWQRAVAEGLVVIETEVVRVPDSSKLLTALQLPAFAHPLAVRSAFAAEDGQAESLAGFFTSKLHVNPADPNALAEALAEVWASALKRPGHFRRDVLIMEMVEARQAGVAFTEREFEDDLINYTGNTADRLVSGLVEGESILLPKLKSLDFGFTVYDLRLEENKPKLWSLRLQHLLRDVRRTFGEQDWDLEWADDGRQSWLVQIRPVTRPPRRNETFTGANLKEILPDLPSRYTTTLIASCASELFAYYRRFDPGLPRQRPMIEIFYGRPFFNLSLLTEMMRRWGLPTRLVTANIGGETDQEYGLKLGRFFSHTIVLLKLGLAQVRAVASARQTIERVLAQTEVIEPTFTACVHLHRWLFITLVTEMISLTAALSGPLLILRQLGLLTEHNARQRTIATDLFLDLEPLRVMAARNSAIRACLAQGQVPDRPDFRRLWQAYLDKHGHRGIYESDIARPRLHEAPADLLRSLAQPVKREHTLPPRTWPGYLTLPLWWQASRNMRAREALRYHTMIGFDRLRQVLLKLAGQAVAEGRLPGRDCLWLLTIAEVRRLDQGWRPEADFFAQRQQEIAHLQGYDLPDLFHRFDDLEQYHRDNRQETIHTGRRLRGISLTTGEVRGWAWILSEPGADLPEGYRAEQTILVARSVDAGWIPTFSRVAGVVVEIGGDLSHGSIILRELGLPAITNVRGATRVIRPGEQLVLRAGAGLVERENKL